MDYYPSTPPQISSMAGAGGPFDSHWSTIAPVSSCGIFCLEVNFNYDAGPEASSAIGSLRWSRESSDSLDTN